MEFIFRSLCKTLIDKVNDFIDVEDKKKQFDLFNKSQVMNCLTDIRPTAFQLKLFVYAQGDINERNDRINTQSTRQSTQPISQVLLI